MIKESHARTVTKAIIYRILSVLAIMLISVYGMKATWAEASQVGAIVVVLGTTIYYIHERLWVRTGWHRSLEGQGFTVATILMQHSQILRDSLHYTTLDLRHRGNLEDYT